MTVRKHTEWDTKLQKLDEAYMVGLEAVAAHARALYVVPYCRKYRMWFFTDMGNWWFEKDGREYDAIALAALKGTKRMLNVLRTPTLLTHDDLGSFMKGCLDYGGKVRPISE